MKITVLGAGMIGVATGYFLQKSGHEVTIIDRQNEVAMECSYSNGAQLSYCKTEPLSSYGSLINGLKWMTKKDAPLLFRFPKDMDGFAWLMRFISNATTHRVRENTKNILNLGLYSRKLMHENIKDFDFDFHYERTGKYFLFRSEKSYTDYISHARFQEPLGAKYEILDPKKAAEEEPAIIDLVGKLYKVVKNPLDESADGHIFTKYLAEKFKSLGGEIKLRHSIDRLNFSSKGKLKTIKSVDITNLETDEQYKISADKYILSLGAYSKDFAKDLGLKLPVMPIKGYSLTMTIEKDNKAPRVSLTDVHNRIVYSRVGNRLRAAGTAEFAGLDHSLTESRINMLIDATKENFPEAGSFEKYDKWACLRPVTPDSVPVLGGHESLDNLIFNTGHGFLGWTQCLSSAKIIDDLINEKEPEINIDPYLISRFN
jgi:D-amino-acid dehydrogenase